MITLNPKPPKIAQILGAGGALIFGGGINGREMRQDLSVGEGISLGYPRIMVQGGLGCRV